MRLGTKPMTIPLPYLLVVVGVMYLLHWYNKPVTIVILNGTPHYLHQIVFGDTKIGDLSPGETREFIIRRRVFNHFSAQALIGDHMVISETNFFFPVGRGSLMSKRQMYKIGIQSNSNGEQQLITERVSVE